ncbi:MAG: 2-oxo acid dehydrogenase subunit E2 [Betaproteobacteria bacterium]|nr:2-oxo acid dehydrogenase subunit E2 [Betaproteobacteria bacterium]MDH3439097.1 2-oxo acid dehydrogenase subunit E2 [Betaproteobacteria bacterium]
MDVVMPQLGETVAEGTVTRWYKKAGDAVKADEPLFDVETDKVSSEIPAPVAGVLAEILVAEGVTAKVGMRLAVIREAGAPAQALAPPVAATVSARDDAPAARSGTGGGMAGRLSPVVSRLIAEHKLDASKITGTGRDGRITREDVLAYVGSRGAAPAAAPAASVETAPLNSIRKRTAEHMAKAWATVPHVLQVVEADFSGVDQARRAAGARWNTQVGFSLTYLPFVACATAAALVKYPRLNASFGGDHLLLHRRVNLGIAVDLEFEGLLVPVVKDAGAKSLPDLARAINDLAARARTGKLKPDDMTECTYTITNNGAFGTLLTAPLISPPQVAVLSTDGVRKRPVVIEDNGGDRVEARLIGTLAQSFDHRAVDGAYSAAFLREVKMLIETRNWAQALQA